MWARGEGAEGDVGEVLISGGAEVAGKAWAVAEGEGDVWSELTGAEADGLKSSLAGKESLSATD